MDKTKILLVDDVEANLISLEYLLHEYFDNLDIISVGSGEEALKVSFSQSLDLIILDIQMPVMDGFETAKFLQSSKKTKEIPIIFLTAAFKEEEFQKKGFAIGAVDYLTKPIDNKHFINKLRLYIEIFTKNRKLKELNENLTTIIAKEKELHRENKRQKKILQTILDTEKNLVIVSDLKRLSFANSAFLEFFCIDSIEGFYEEKGSLIELFLNEPNTLHFEDEEEMLEMLLKHDEAQRVVCLHDCNGKKKSFYLNLSKTEDEDDLYLLSFTDITKMQENYTTISKQAYYDGLTGIYNRTKFNEFLEYEIQRASRIENTFCCAILDIDHFKNFNDKYGHLVGDEILIMIAQIINKNTRVTDKFARWGGEEFVMLFSDTSLDQATKITQKFRGLVKSLLHPKAGGVTASFGITQYKKGDTINSLFKRCDDALYEAKEDGRDNVKVLL